MAKQPKDTRTTQEKVQELFEKLAGDKLYKVATLVEELVEQGKSRNRAMADALEKFGCV